MSGKVWQKMQSRRLPAMRDTTVYIPGGFTVRGEGNEQPPETVDKVVMTRMADDYCSAIRYHSDEEVRAWFDGKFKANGLPWKIPDGPGRIIAWKIVE